MYSRAREEGVRIPGDYCGTAFYEGIAETKESEAEAIEQAPLRDGSPDADECAARTRGILNIPVFSWLSELGLSLPSFGTEDILIIATAAFLFFSKSGDKECAIMLLLLIFVTS